MKLYLVRHGETDANREVRLQGHSDTRLSERGRIQAQAIGERFRGLQLDSIFSSDLSRAMETALPISEVLRLPIQKTDKLRERNFGIYQGRLYSDYLAAFQLSGLEKTEFCPEEGESERMIEKRISEFLYSLRENHAGKSLVLVSHSGPLRVILRLLCGANYAELRTIETKNTSLSILDWSDEMNPTPSLINCTQHLEQAQIAFLGSYE